MCTLSNQNQSHKKQKDCLGAALAVLHTYVDNQAILEPIFQRAHWRGLFIDLYLYFYM